MPPLPRPLLAIIFLLGAVLVFHAGARCWRLHLLSQGRTCFGRVSALHPGDSKRGTIEFSVEFDYPVNSPAYHGVQKVGRRVGAVLKPGDHVPLVFPVDSPDQARLGTPDEVWGESMWQYLMLGLLGLFFCLASFVELRRENSERGALRKLLATLRSPFVGRARFESPRDGFQ